MLNPRIEAFAIEIKRKGYMRVTKLILVHGTSFGTALAIAISFNINHSVLWAIIHGLFSWFYVIYYILSKV